MNVKIYKKTGVSLHFIYRDAILSKQKQKDTGRHNKFIDFLVMLKK
jgi:hypothetical protein